MTIVRVATFNIRHGLGVDGRLSLDRTARVIRATEASFIGLQEIDRSWPRSGSVDQAQALADLTGLCMSFHSTFERGGGDYGLGLLAPRPVETSFVKLPQRGSEEPRGLILARTEELSLIVTHLSQDPAARPAQMEEVLAIAEEVPPPVVIMGDLNETRRGLEAFFEAGFASTGRHATTRPRVGPGRQIDFIFAGRGARVVTSSTLISAASDHLPLMAEVELPSVNLLKE